MKLFLLSITFISALAAIASPPSHLLKRATVSQAVQSLNTISADVTALTNAIMALPTTGATYADVIPIGLNGLLVAGDTALAIADFKSLTNTIDPVTALALLTSAQHLEGVVVTATNLMVSKKAALESVLPGAGIFSMTNFRTLAANLATAMQAVAPITAPPLLTNPIKSGLDATFATAITAFGGTP